MIVIAAAVWLGILTSISPCPLATNIAAVSFLSKNVNHPKAVLFCGLAYTFGRVVSYVVLGVMIVYSLSSVSATAYFFQKYMNRALGPVLVLMGLVLLDLIKLNISGFSLSYERQKAFAGSSVRGAFILGVLFALSFCPVSAALFFGSLIPLALKNPGGVILPVFYGVGTGLPVLLFSVGIAAGISSVSRWFHILSAFENYARKATGVIFMFIGSFYIWNYIIKSIF